MKKIIFGLMIITGSLTYAQPSADSATETTTVTTVMQDAPSEECQGLNCLPKLIEYLKNLGAYLGYKIQIPPEGAEIRSELIEPESTTLKNLGISSISTYLGSIIPPMYSKDDVSPQKFNLIPSQDKQGSAFINETAGSALLSKNASGGSQGVITSAEQTFAPPAQSDPIAQTLLTLISTSPKRIGTSSVNLNTAKSCKDCVDAPTLLAKNAGLPDSLLNFYNPEKNDSPMMVATVLNSNSLITPFLLSPSAPAEPTADSRNPSVDVTAQQAAQFIQYVSGSLNTINMPEMELLTFFPLTKPGDKGFEDDKFTAAVNNYILDVRTYAARVSVGVGNLYAMLTKRLPQKGADGNTSSQAYNEYKMATWRLYGTDANKADDKQWIDKINTASSSTVQKEMVMLLAEINYQLYLNRQQQERQLMNDSVLLLTNLTAGKPDSDAIVKAIRARQQK